MDWIYVQPVDILLKLLLAFSDVKGGRFDQGACDTLAKLIFEHKWEDLKGSFSFEQGKVSVSGLPFEMGRWKIALMVVVGVRGGISEWLYVYDTAEEHEVSRLKFCGKNNDLLHNLVDLREIRVVRLAQGLDRSDLMSYIRKTVFPGLLQSVKVDSKNMIWTLEEIMNNYTLSSEGYSSAWGQGKDS